MRLDNLPLEWTCELDLACSGTSLPRPLHFIFSPWTCGQCFIFLATLVLFLQSCLTFRTIQLTEVILLTKDALWKYLGALFSQQSLHEHTGLLLTWKWTLAVEWVLLPSKKKNNFKEKGPLFSPWVYVFLKACLLIFLVTTELAHYKRKKNTNRSREIISMINKFIH